MAISDECSKRRGNVKRWGASYACLCKSLWCPAIRPDILFSKRSVIYCIAKLQKMQSFVELLMPRHSSIHGLQYEERFIHVKASSQANSGDISEAFGGPTPVERCNVFGQRSIAWRLQMNGTQHTSRLWLQGDI